VAIEASGAPGSPALAQELVSRGGRLLLVGLQSAPSRIDLSDLVLREIEVQTTVAHVCDVDLQEAIDLLTTTDLGATALDRVVPLEAVVGEGLEPLAEGRVNGKVVVATVQDA
jgi:(R,R)-butanediol dehydrogenase / meso-butanediol dehydrogenase / diacetyl reductase